MPNYKKLFIEILSAIEKNSTCSKIQVAAIIVKDGRIISTGWNGVSTNKKHCNEIFPDNININEKPYLNEHHDFARRNENHAEMNAISFAAKHGTKTDKTTMFCTYSPCLSCAKIIVAAGIVQYFYISLYERVPEGVQFLIENGVNCEQIDI